MFAYNLSMYDKTNNKLGVILYHSSLLSTSANLSKESSPLALIPKVYLKIDSLVIGGRPNISLYSMNFLVANFPSSSTKMAYVSRRGSKLSNSL